jgi:hypothetical protein
MGTQRQYPVRIALPDPPPLDAHSAGQVAGRAMAAGVARGAANAKISLAANPMLASVAPLIAAVGDQHGRVAMRDFLDGLVGNPKGGDKVTLPATVAAKPAAAARVAAVAAPAADPALVSPQARMAGFWNEQLKHPLSMREAVAISGQLPQESKPPTVKDSALASLLDYSKQLHQDDITTAAKNDDLMTARKLVDQANQRRWDRDVAAVSGISPMMWPQAQMLNNANNEGN